MADTIRESTFRELIEANSVRATQAVGMRGGYVIAICCGQTDRLLASTRGDVRVFTNLTTLATYLRKLGISHFEVDSADYEPERVRPARPDRAEVLRRTRTRPRQGSIFEGQS